MEIIIVGIFCEAVFKRFLSFPAFEGLHAEGQHKLLKGKTPKVNVNIVGIPAASTSQIDISLN